MSEQKTAGGNKGYLFPNKKSNDSQPDFRGKLTIDGKEWLVSGWKRSKDGEEMISLSVTDPASLPPRKGADPGAAPARPASPPSGAPSAAPGALGSIFDDLPG